MCIEWLRINRPDQDYIRHYPSLKGADFTAIDGPGYTFDVVPNSELLALQAMPPGYCAIVGYTPIRLDPEATKVFINSEPTLTTCQCPLPDLMTVGCKCGCKEMSKQ